MTQPALANRRFPFTGAPVDPLLLCMESSTRLTATDLCKQA
jgi:hypothetical protein